ncbi:MULTISPECIES: anti-repressor SinI [Bacillus]|uniref:anti-repressor SinI n=1 Tax=Bacillus TaxID=1386 RepID=UPI001F5C9209|nr:MULTISPECIES: anti-repressor SinI family protein [Bacillus]MCI3196555.1 DNA-binding anti-repressor SinI [Bacillus sp. HU-1818]MCY8514070.1 anti-repressor SinI family protein [Bacillus atrophaeus]MCY8518107.1 anti-repressor SinI family protein [Bacillus atrophaeus]MCY8993671.1 anti-repressor SinI family protein [Bacillus atrophaeus]
MKNAKREFLELDQEWVELMKRAREANINPEEIRKYLNLHKKSARPVPATRSHTINPF